MTTLTYRLNALWVSMGLLGFMAIFLTWVSLIIGWVLNIFDIVATAGGQFTVLLAVRLLGVVIPPLGGVLGLFS